MKNKQQKKTSPSTDGIKHDTIKTDPLGSYTGTPDNPNEQPIQDADDL